MALLRGIPECEEPSPAVAGEGVEDAVGQRGPAMAPTAPAM
jgi:hypothetical protein